MAFNEIADNYTTKRYMAMAWLSEKTDTIFVTASRRTFLTDTNEDITFDSAITQFSVEQAKSLLLELALAISEAEKDK